MPRNFRNNLRSTRIPKRPKNRGKSAGGGRRARAHLQEKLQQVQVVGTLPAILLQQPVDGRLEEKGVVDGIQTNPLLQQEDRDVSQRTGTPQDPQNLPNPLTFLYQHGCPRRVRDASMMSSATRKKAWNCKRLR